MANKKITEMTYVTSPADADLLPTIQDVSTTPVNKKITWTVIKSFLKTYFDLIYQPGANVKAYGATGDGITDDTTAIQAAFNASTNVYFPSGTYIMCSVTITNDGTHIHGDGVTSVLRFKTGETGTMLIAGTNRIIVSKVRLAGGVNSDYEDIEAMTADRSGLSLMSNKNTIITEITIDGFQNTGLLVTNTEKTSLFNRFSVLNSKISSCWIGIETGLDEENYTKYSGLEIYYCRYAVMLGCGNINFANSNLYKNYYAFYVDGTRPNDAHGNINSCLINHNVHSIYITDVYGGYIIVGNNIYEGKISIIDSSGVRIANNQITVDEFFLHGSGRNWIVDNNIRTTYDNIITHDGGEDDTLFINNRFTDGTFLENRSVGDLLNSGNGLDATTKRLYLVNGQYNSDTEPEGYMVIQAWTSDVYNLISIGGGTNDYNAANLIRFMTASDLITRNGTERMRITNEGNVGINTNAPETITQIKGDGSTLYPLAVGTNLLPESGHLTGIGFGFSTTANRIKSAVGMVIDALSYSRGDMVFCVDSTEDAANVTIADEKMRITNGGNIGIGTTAPLSKLSINGGLHVGGDSDAGDNNILADGTITATGGFGCNSKSAQTAYASGGALNAYAAGAKGLDSDANMEALHAMVVSMRAALVANGIMS